MGLFIKRYNKRRVSSLITLMKKERQREKRRTKDCGKNVISLRVFLAFKKKFKPL